MNPLINNNKLSLFVKFTQLNTSALFVEYCFDLKVVVTFGYFSAQPTSLWQPYRVQHVSCDAANLLREHGLLYLGSMDYFVGVARIC